MNYSLETKLSQKMTLTKQLKQSLDILQMTVQDIETLVNTEINDNPIIEVERKNEIDWEKYLEHMKNTSIKISNNFYEDYDSDNNPENYVPQIQNITEYLEEEICFLTLDKKEKQICKFLVTLIDDDGYFRANILECAKDLLCDEELVIKVLRKIQTLEPIGIGARNISECLQLQLESLGVNDDVIYSIIEYDLENIAKHKYKELCKKYIITEEQLKEYIELIKSLDPKPGKIFGEIKPLYILPDVIVEKIDDNFIVRTNNDATFNININSTYEKMIKDDIDNDAKQYLKDKFNSANNLIKSIEQRKNTIIKVAIAILEKQITFFEGNKKELIPMRMKDIADITGFHESTISRTVNGKYMLTPLGLYEFKYFFSNSIKDISGESISNKSIKTQIQNIINEENKRKPLSDKKICDILLSNNLDISRRTVAKYREELGIASSSERKEI